MPKTTINYDLLPDEATKKEQAIKDIISWIGPKKFKQLSSDIRRCDPPMTYAQFEFMCGMGGIEGYPVRVWAEDCGIEVPKKGDEDANEHNN